MADELDQAVGKALEARRSDRKADTTPTHTSLADALAGHFTSKKKETTDHDDR